MIRISQIKLHPGHDDNALYAAVRRTLHLKHDDLFDLHIVRRSTDARDKENIRYVYSVDVVISGEDRILRRCAHDRNVAKSDTAEYVLPGMGEKKLSSRPVIVGSGPAGLFCAYYLAAYGFRPVIIEQGEPVEERQGTVDSYLENNMALDPSSNIQFGEGGAGTFSDGKLLSRVKDSDGRKSEVLKTFVKHGAPDNILYLAKPHIGTDILRDCIKSMREFILGHGGSFMFRTRFADYAVQDGHISHITIEQDGKRTEMPCCCLVLAIGHSSRETISLLAEKGMKIEAKPFAVGVRVQHSQDSINKAQYGEDYKSLYKDKLEPAEYKLTARTSDGRAVYSFCMCPGGYVINSSSEPGMICVNGMSYSGRNGPNANSAIIVSVSPDDYGAGDDPLAAIRFQQRIETKAYNATGGLIPTQRLEDFVNGRISRDFAVLEPQTKGSVSSCDINTILPEFICRDIKEAMEIFGRQIKGFDDPDTIINAPETRTSSPVRIVRGEDLQSVSVAGIYPCGEGAGYAGGITSSAIDGIKVFEKIYTGYRAD